MDCVAGHSLKCQAIGKTKTEEQNNKETLNIYYCIVAGCFTLVLRMTCVAEIPFFSQSSYFNILRELAGAVN